MASTTEVARRYFEALAAHDIDAALEYWAAGGVDRFVGQQELVAPDGVRQYFTEDRRHPVATIATCTLQVTT